MFQKLPIEIQRKILKIAYDFITRLELVCSEWNKELNAPLLWREKIMHSFPSIKQLKIEHALKHLYRILSTKKCIVISSRYEECIFSLTETTQFECSFNSVYGNITEGNYTILCLKDGVETSIFSNVKITNDYAKWTISDNKIIIARLLKGKVGTKLTGSSRLMLHICGEYTEYMSNMDIIRSMDSSALHHELFPEISSTSPPLLKRKYWSCMSICKRSRYRFVS